MTNALTHTDGEAELRLKWARDRLRMSVWDSSPVPPGLRPPAREDEEGGRGLGLLEAVADRWDHFPLGAEVFGKPSKVVWCEIGRTAPAEW